MFVMSVQAALFVLGLSSSVQRVETHCAAFIKAQPDHTEQRKGREGLPSAGGHQQSAWPTRACGTAAAAALMAAPSPSAVTSLFRGFLRESTSAACTREDEDSLS